MELRYFTLDEANALLPHIRPLLAEILERRARIVANKDDLQPLLSDLSSNVGSKMGTQIALEFVRIETLVDQIKAYGCSIKDLNVGLLDFLAEINGRDVYLCWRYGEERIEYYHELHNGFMGRRPLS